MGVLAPLYIAGLLGIALPILFHLIRRNPHGRQDFSSLMFLAPSPPRLTRRSRLTNIVLLILRALALAALAFAFARPFLTGTMDKDNATAKGRRIAVLLDTSASMRRGDLWKQATAKVDEVLDGVKTGDQVALYMFDDRVKQVFSFDEWNQTDPALRMALIKSRLPTDGPGWGGTKMGEAVSALADQLAETAGAKNDASATVPRQLVVITDMQEGSKPAAMQGHQWPENVWLEVLPVKLSTRGNASLQWAKQGTEEVAEGAKNSESGAATQPADNSPESGLRVRVSNEKDSTRDQFTVVWANEKGPIAGMAPVKVYVPAGRSQMVKIAWPPVAAETPAGGTAAGAATMPAGGTTRPAGVNQGEADRLVLRGDESDFDNTLFVVPPRLDTLKLVYIGEDVRAQIDGLYYLENAVWSKDKREVEVVERKTQEALQDGDLVGTRLVVVAGALSAENAGKVRNYVENGGDVLYSMMSSSAEGLSGLLGVPALDVKEGTGGTAGGTNFALISRVDVTHDLFTKLADARFSDFTKIHFWRHQRVKPPEGSGVNVLAWFDDGSPFLIEKGVGKGWVRVMTCGLSLGDSEFAKSTKFVPFVEALVKRKDEVAVEAQYTVHEPIALPTTPLSGGRAAAASQGREIVTPDGKHVELAAGAATYSGGDRPGIYHLLMNGQDVPLAVNLAADESRTVPLDSKELDQWGAKMGNVPEKMDEMAKKERQLKLAELENRQKLWRWLIVGVLGLLGVETLLAGHVARRALKEEVAT